MPVILGSLAVLAIAAAAFLVFRILGGSDASGAAAASPGASTATSSSTASSGPTATATSSTTTSAPPTTSSVNAAATSAIEGCVTRQNAAQAVVDTASKGAKDWSDHVQGQNDIDSGARTLIDVKTNTWGPTRAAGPGEVAAFQGALNNYTAVSGCQDVDSVTASGDMKAKLDACAAHQKALDAYVDAAKAVIADWQTHLSEMADHADGHINSYEAQANWLKRWKDAPSHLDPYKAAADALAKAPACSA